MPKMRQTMIQANSPLQQVQTFCKFAAKYAGDYFSDELAPIRQWSLQELFKQIRARYLREQGEQIIRPLYYWRDGVGGDCDDAFIQYTAFFLSAGVPAQNIIVCEAREPQNDYYSHIFSAIETPRGVVILDNLPESKFNQLDYPGELVRFTRVSEYL